MRLDDPMNLQMFVQVQGLPQGLPGWTGLGVYGLGNHF